MKSASKIKIVLAVALAAVMAFAAWMAGRPKPYTVGDYFDTKGAFAWSWRLLDKYSTDYAQSLMYEGKDPPAFLSQTEGTVFGAPVTAMNYSHVAYHGAEDCIMSVLICQNKNKDVIGVVYTAPYNKTDEISKHLDGAFERVRTENISSVGDSIFTQTWTNPIGMTVSLGEYDGRNVFFVTDAGMMKGCGIWK